MACRRGQERGYDSLLYLKPKPSILDYRALDSGPRGFTSKVTDFSRHRAFARKVRTHKSRERRIPQHLKNEGMENIRFRNA